MSDRSLEQLSDSQFVQLYNKFIKPENQLTIDEYKELFEGENWREILEQDLLRWNKNINIIDLNNIKNLLRPLPPPPPKETAKYIDSEEYKRNQEILEEKRKQIELREKELLRLQEEYELLAKEQKEKTKQILIKELPRHANEWREFNRSEHASDLFLDDLLRDELDPQTQNILRIKSYNEWKALYSEERQEKIIDKITDRILKSPLDWYIDFDGLNNYGKEKLSVLLIDILENYIAPKLKATDKYIF